jgi:hypothetical protein
MRANIVKAAAACIAALTTGGCLLFTSVSELGGGDVANEGGAGTAGNTGDFAPADALAHDAPGVTGIAVDDTNVYWTNSSTGLLWRAPKTSTNAAVTMAVDRPPTPGEVTVFNGRVYVASSVQPIASSGLYSYAPDGTGVRQELDYCTIARVVTADSLILSVDGASSSDDRIGRFSVDRQLSTLQKLGDALPSALAFDGTAVFYYVASMPRTIQRVPLGGSAGLFVQEDDVADMLADATTLYALTITGNLVAHPIAGGAPHVLASGLIGARRLAADDAAFYVSAAGLTPTSGRIVQIRKTDGVARDLAANQAGPSAIAATSSGIYWLNAGDGSVMRAVRR